MLYREKIMVMKHIVLTVLLLLGMGCGLQAKKVVKTPYFMACNTTRIEVARVTLGKDTTWLEVKIYGRQGDKVRIDSTAVLQAGGKRYEYWGNAGFSKGEWTYIPASGEMDATLKFRPLPMDAGSFDFLETPGSDEGWAIYGVQLNGQKPQAAIPERLLNKEPDTALPLPAPELKVGKSVIKGRILGYKPEYGVTLRYYDSPWFFMYFTGKELKIAEDGTFRHETEVLLPSGAALWVSRSKIDLFLVPGGELDITINLPEIFYSQSHLLSPKGEDVVENRIWFEGDYAGLNAELLRFGKMKSLSGTDDYYSDICGMTPQAYKKYLFKRYEDMLAKLAKSKEMSQACRTYIRSNLDMNLFNLVYNYKSNLGHAPMLAGKKGVKRADMTVDSTSYFKEIMQLDILHAPEQKYYDFYMDFVRKATGRLRDRFAQDSLWQDMLLAERASRSLSKYMPMTAKERMTVDSISSPDLRQLFLMRNGRIESELASELEAAKKKAGYTVVEVEKSITADSLLQVITRPYRGKMVLIDMWNTWCGPCMRAMKSLKPLKEELKEVVYLYIADETSPEGKWKVTIPDIPGIHCRISNEQSKALAKLYEYPGIPTYFVVNREGDISYKVTGFPGLDALRKELTQ